jgi:uncharacterized Tic20 family protein
MSVADEIEKLNNLRQNGAITEEDYQKAKNSLLRQHESMGEKFGNMAGSISSDENTWSMFIHLSLLCVFIFPLLGLVVPVILWQVKKNQSQVIDRHGRIVVNWIITEIILGIVFGILCFILIGIPLLAVLIVLGIVFPVIGGIKANNGEVWSYPYSIKFFPVD